jgi:hypothetical protein
MKAKKLVILSLFLSTSLFTFAFFGTDIFEEISLALKSGNCKEVSRYFDSRVELKIDDVEDIYSKTQAELILKDFFEKYPPVNFIIKHKNFSPKGLPYVIGYLQTTSGRYRTYILFKDINGKLYIRELQFEKE